MSLRIVLPFALVTASGALAFDDQRVITLSGTEIGDVRTPDVMDEDPASLEIDIFDGGDFIQTLILESDGSVTDCARTLRAAAGTAAPVTVTLTIDMAAQTMNGVMLENCVTSR